MEQLNPTHLLPPPNKTVYLSGPITGLSYKGATEWRGAFAALLHPHIHPLSPMRGKEFLSRMRNLRGDPFMKQYDNPIARPKGILTRDTNDVLTCDAMVANFLGAERVSIGTCVEFGMAHAWRKPVVLVMERKANGQPHAHAFLTEIAGYWVDDLDEAAQIVNHILTPGV